MTSIPDSQTEAICGCIKTEDYLIQRVGGTWQLFVEEHEIILYNAKEVGSILKTRRFLEETKRLIELGTFNETHYFKSNIKKNRMFWTGRGLSILKNIFLITGEEEKVFSSYFHFVSDCMSELCMIKEVEKRYNIRNPEERKSNSLIRAYLLHGWASFEKKDKKSFAEYVSILKDIKDDIEKKVIHKDHVPEGNKSFIAGHYNSFKRDYIIQW